MRKNKKKGFTLAELLIVVAIIGVLTAIAIPVFTAQLEKSRIAADKANVRSWYAQEVAAYLSSTSTYSHQDYAGPSLVATGATVTTTGSGDGWGLTYSNSAGDGLVLPGT